MHRPAHSWLARPGDPNVLGDRKLDRPSLPASKCMTLFFGIETRFVRNICSAYNNNRTSAAIATCSTISPNAELAPVPRIRLCYRCDPMRQSAEAMDEASPRHRARPRLPIGLAERLLGRWHARELWEELELAISSATFGCATSTANRCATHLSDTRPVVRFIENLFSPGVGLAGPLLHSFEDAAGSHDRAFWSPIRCTASRPANLQLLCVVHDLACDGTDLSRRRKALYPPVV